MSPSPVASPSEAGSSTGRVFPAHGLLVVDKPVGVTSHDVVDLVRRRLRIKSAGHLGTLDPGASGLLVVAIGAATRCALVWQGGEKTYEGTVRFGVVTTTQDLMGEVIEQHPVDLDPAAVREATRALVGAIDQVPPMVSALRIGGERLYRLARRGVSVDRPPRRVHVTSWEWLEFSLPEASFRVRCSAGTYVRTLAHDLGARLGTGGALRSLRRLRSEPFGLERSVTSRELDLLTPGEVWSRAGIALEEALSCLPSAELDPTAAVAIGHGRVAAVRSEDVRPGVPAEGADLEAPRALPSGPRSVVFLGPGRSVLALGELTTDPAVPGGLLARPHLVFPWAVKEGRS